MFTTRVRRFWRNRQHYKQREGSSRLSSMRKKPKFIQTISMRRSARLKIKPKKKTHIPKFDIDISKVKSKYVKQKKG